MDKSSPRSIPTTDSLDEIQQVVVDPENRVVLRASLAVVIENAKRGRERLKLLQLPALNPKKSQRLITDFFSGSFNKIETSSAAAYVGHIASLASSVSSNGEQEPQIPKCEDEIKLEKWPTS